MGSRCPLHRGLHGFRHGIRNSSQLRIRYPLRQYLTPWNEGHAPYDTIIKAGLAPYWDMHAPHGTTAIKKEHNAGHIEMKIELGAEGANIHVHTALMHSHYEGVDLLQPLQYGLRNARVGVSNLFLYKTGLTGVCNVAPESVVTFDNVTLKYECPTCYTLVSADCSAQPRYAVFAKKTDKALPLAVKIYAGGHHMEFTPPT